jgi:hypothetical protein
MELWRHRARLSVEGSVDGLRRVLDPTDRGGAKNVYIDHYLKHHLVRHLNPGPEDVIFEVGSGTGRLVEFLAPRVRHAYGTDLIDDFVVDCRSARDKAPNTTYLLQSELDSLVGAGISKLYLVWVLMYLESDAGVVALLERYRRLAPELRTAVLIEQVKREEEDELVDESFYCRYRTLSGFLTLFEKAGFRATRATVLPERRVGPLYNALRVTYRALPRRAAPLGDWFFRADARLTRHLMSPPSPIQRTPTDVAFELVVP